MTTKFIRIPRIIPFIIIGILFFVGLTGLTRVDQGKYIASAGNSSSSDFLRYLQKSDNVVALNSDEVKVFAEELMQKRISEKVLYLSSEAAVNTEKEVLGSIYKAGILIVAIDTPISVLYEAVDTVPLGKNAPMKSTQKDLKDLTAPHEKLVVVSMIYSYDYMHHVNGYYFLTDFYAYPEHIELAVKEIVDSAEEEFESADRDSLESDEKTGSTKVLSQCNVSASISWNNGNNPGTRPKGKAKCLLFKPFSLHLVGTMENDCGDNMHQVGSLNKWNSTPYSASEVSGTMTGFTYGNAPDPNECTSSGGHHKNPLQGTANVTAEARDYSPSSLQSDSESSSKTVYYPL